MNNHSIVVDIGSSAIKAGISGSDTPHLLVETLVGKETLPNITGPVKTKTIGSDARANRTLKLVVPVQRGQIVDFDDMIDLMKYVYDNLHVESKHSSITLCQSPLNPKPKTEKMVQLMFEQFEIDNIYIGDHGKFIMNALNIRRGLALELGHGITESIPVYEDYCVLNAVNQLPFGGLDISEQLIKLLMKEHQSNITTNDMMYGQKMKEEHCIVKSVTGQQNSTAASSIKTPYKLSDNNYCEIREEKFIATEGIFRPINMSHNKGVQDIILESFNSCDNSIQVDLVKNVVISGGTSMLTGFVERLQYELSQYRNDINIISVPNRKYLSYAGASKYSSSEFMKQLWLTKKEFDEGGVSMVHRKFI